MSDTDLLDLGGQVAVVTGGGQNAGRAIALELDLPPAAIQRASPLSKFPLELDLPLVEALSLLTRRIVLSLQTSIT